MSLPYKVGLTGGIGSGKSTVTNLFLKLGVKVLDADKISHDLTRPGEPALAEIVNIFGNQILDSTGKLKRVELGKKVFNNTELKNKLEGILHPKIFDIIVKNIREIDTGYCILSIPLLLETGSEYLIDTLLIVDCSEELQFKRIINRDGITPDIAKNIIENQVPREERLKKANEIIDNSDDFNHLEDQVYKLHEEYTKRSLVLAN